MNYCRHCEEGVDCELCFDKLAYLFGWVFIWL
jgi:hypothetical protein